MIFSSSNPLAFFLVFCRIGACLMVAPGFASERVPVRVRLLIAVAASLALFPGLAGSIAQALSGATIDRMLLFGAREFLVGVAFGLLARFFFLALETLITTVNMTIGLGNIFSAAVDAEATPALSTFIVTAALTLMFLTDQHLELLQGIFLSYRLAPIADTFSRAYFLSDFGETLSEAYVLALRISSPFLLFAIVVNLGFGFLARLTPQAPIYFISAPFMIVAGLYSVLLVSGDFLPAFAGQFGSWLRHG